MKKILILILIIYLMIIGSSCFATEFNPPFPNGELVYPELDGEYFPMEYPGYLLITNTTKSSSNKIKSGTYNSQSCYYFPNVYSGKESAVYLDHYDSAWMNGVSYDIREYPYRTSNSSPSCWIYLSNGRCIKGDGESKGNLYREFHFYESGHCGEPAYEVEFYGIVDFHDIDDSETVGIYGGLVNAYLSRNTYIQSLSDGKSWRGTVAAQYNGSDFDPRPHAAVYATIHSTPSDPLIVYYNTTNARGAHLNFAGHTINYTIVADGANPIPAGAESWTLMVVDHGQYLFNQNRNITGYSFSGWYWDSGLTDKVNESEIYIITEDKTVYGSYRALQHIDKVMVDVTGTITDTGTNGGHVCTVNAVQKYDGTYHWDECSICSPRYVKAGRPNDSASWSNQYLEIKTNGSGQRILVIKNSLATHNYTNDYWTMGTSCSTSNHHVFVCDCGYTYNDDTGRTSHNFGGYGNNLEFYYLTSSCRVCFLQRIDHYCIKEDGTAINCNNLGQCKLCSHMYAKAQHAVNHGSTRHGTNRVETGNIKCSVCNIDFGTLNQNSINRLSTGNIEFVSDVTLSLGVTAYNINITSWDSSITYTNNTTNSGNNFHNICSITYTNNSQSKAQIRTGYHITLSDGSTANVYVWNTMSAENNAPTIQTNVNEISSNNLSVLVEGTEDYCSAVTIEMIDISNNAIVYSSTANVVNNNYSKEIFPDIEVGLTPKNYNIVVKDVIGNSSSNIVQISNFDKISPSVIKQGQLNFYQGESMWSTLIPWSKSKDFDITAFDEGTDKVDIEIQNVTSTKTNVTFEDDYGYTIMDDSTSPKKYTRQYTFTGDVTGYVTLLASAKDYANNETNDYFRVYNLDNTAPYVTGTPVADTINKKFIATLGDAGSGIKYFGLVPYLGGDVVYPTAYETTPTTTASTINKWYPVSLISANATTGEPEHGQSSINVDLIVAEGGSYAIVIEDYVGNQYNHQVSIEGIDNTPPSGAIFVRNTVTLYNDKEAINTRDVVLDIEAYDNNSGVDKMAIINQEDIPTSKLGDLWEDFAEEKEWTLTDGDGEKQIFLILKDNSGNITIIPNSLSTGCTVTLDSQGGTGGTPFVTAYQGQPMPTAVMPTKEGYIFDGYFDTPEATGGNQYYTASGSSAQNFDKAAQTTLYARWRIGTFTVTLNANGGSNGTTSVTATLEQAMPSATMPTRTGYTFQGYYDTSAATGGTQYYTAAGASARSWDKMSNTTLYARWTPYTYTIVFNGNGSTSGTMSNLSMTYDTAKNLTTNAYSKTDYVFAGWNTKADWSGTDYSNQQSVNNLTTTNGATITLYAKWAKSRIGTTYYKTVQAGVDAATAGQTVVVLGNADEQVIVGSDKELTIDLNNKTLTSTSGTALKNSGTMTIQNGTISNNVSGKNTFEITAGTTTVRNCRIRHNASSGGASAVCQRGGSSYFYSCSAVSSGIGVYTENSGTYMYFEAGEFIGGNLGTWTTNNSVFIANGGGSGASIMRNSNGAINIVYGIGSDGIGFQVIGDYSRNNTKIATWTSANGQDDLIWHTPYEVKEVTNTGSQRRFRFDIKKSSHGNQSGQYVFHLYNGGTFLYQLVLNL